MTTYLAYFDREGTLLFKNTKTHVLYWETDNGLYMGTDGSKQRKDELFKPKCKLITDAGEYYIMPDKSIVHVPPHCDIN